MELFELTCCEPGSHPFLKWHCSKRIDLGIALVSIKRATQFPSVEWQTRALGICLECRSRGLLLYYQIMVCFPSFTLFTEPVAYTEATSQYGDMGGLFFADYERLWTSKWIRWPNDPTIAHSWKIGGWAMNLNIDAGNNRSMVGIQLKDVVGNWGSWNIAAWTDASSIARALRRPRRPALPVGKVAAVRFSGFGTWKLRGNPWKKIKPIIHSPTFSFGVIWCNLFRPNPDSSGCFKPCFSSPGACNKQRRHKWKRRTRRFAVPAANQRWGLAPAAARGIYQVVFGTHWFFSTWIMDDDDNGRKSCRWMYMTGIIT